MGCNAMLTAVSDDLFVLFRLILKLFSLQQDFAREGFDAHEDFIAARSCQQGHEVAVTSSDLNITLQEELKSELFFNDFAKQLSHFRKLVEVVRSEHVELDPCISRDTQGLERCFQCL